MHIYTKDILDFLFGATGFGLIAHAVNTFPTPDNKYGKWLLGTIQFAVGQRTIANNTFQGLQTDAVGVKSNDSTK